MTDARPVPARARRRWSVRPSMSYGTASRTTAPPLSPDVLYCLQILRVKCGRLWWNVPASPRSHLCNIESHLQRPLWLQPLCNAQTSKGRDPHWVRWSHRTPGDKLTTSDHFNHRSAALYSPWSRRWKVFACLAYVFPWQTAILSLTEWHSHCRGILCGIAFDQEIHRLTKKFYIKKWRVAILTRLTDITLLSLNLKQLCWENCGKWFWKLTYSSTWESIPCRSATMFFRMFFRMYPLN